MNVYLELSDENRKRLEESDEKYKLEGRKKLRKILETKTVMRSAVKYLNLKYKQKFFYFLISSVLQHLKM